jgi:hypothetical protein
VARYILREVSTLGLGFPVAALGTAAWYLPHFLTGLVCRVMKPEIETVATVKLLAGIVLYPVTYLLWIVLAASVLGAPAALLAAVVLPPLGFATLYWHHRRQDAWEDVRTFFQVIRRPQVREALTDQRAVLAGELDALAAEWMDESRR